MQILLVICAIFVSINQCRSINIDDYGAVPNNNSVAACQLNTQAIEKALLAANASSSDKTVLLSAGRKYFIFNVEVSHLINVKFQIDGILVTSDDIQNWPYPARASLRVEDSTGFELAGSGLFDGQGYLWWVYVFETTIDKRPLLVAMSRCKDVTIRDLRFKNSPFWHLQLYNMLNLVVRNIDIRVDVIKQEELYKRYGLWDKKFSLPVFPLNTDGIDPAGKNILIEDSYIENFDDAVAVKPSNGDAYFSKCSENMLIRNCKVKYSIGMTIGSVPPNGNINCVRNITFENIEMEYPLKGIYVKTNPGDSGYGIIDQITYRNITATDSPWMPIWIGPQQQRQPGSKGTGCSFLYPIVDKCPTQPRVPISNVKLENVRFEGSLLMPGVILCDPTKPCTDMTFKNVTNNGAMILQKDYVCKNVKGVQTGNSPPLSCFEN